MNLFSHFLNTDKKEIDSRNEKIFSLIKDENKNSLEYCKFIATLFTTLNGFFLIYIKGKEFYFKDFYAYLAFSSIVISILVFMLSYQQSYILIKSLNNFTKSNDKEYSEVIDFYAKKSVFIHRINFFSLLFSAIIISSNAILIIDDKNLISYIMGLLKEILIKILQAL